MHLFVCYLEVLCKSLYQFECYCVLYQLLVDIGRAWLYQALSDQLLESYIRCYTDNVKLVCNFYMQDALVLDYQVCSTATAAATISFW